MPRGPRQLPPAEHCRRVVRHHCKTVSVGNPAGFEWCRRFGYGACEVDPRTTVSNIARQRRRVRTRRSVRGLGQPPPAHAYRDGSLGVVGLEPTFAMVGLAAIVGIAAGYALIRVG